MNINQPYIQSVSFVMFILFLVSMNHWIGWDHRTSFAFVCSLVLVFFFFAYNIQINYSKKNITAILILYIGQLLFNSNVINHPISIITQIPTYLIPIIFIICLKEEDKIIVFSLITKWFAWLMIPAIILYIILLFIELPAFYTTEWSNEEQAEKGYGICDNYIFLLTPHYRIADDSIARFRGPFIEPGHLGMMCAFILMANKHDYSNKYNRIILLSLIISFSLAGWMLGIIGYLFYRYNQNKITLSFMIGYSIIILAFVGFATYYNDGYNVLNEKILSRLQIEEDGTLSGDNRNSEYTNILLANMTSNFKTFCWGYNSSYLDSLQDAFSTRVSGSGMRLSLVRHGFIPVFILLCFYAYSALKNTKKDFAILLIIFLLLISFQRFYTTWFSWIICYCAAIANHNYKRKA